MNFEPYFELDISIYFSMTIIWSPGNSQKRKTRSFLHQRQVRIEIDRYCDIVKNMKMYKVEIF